MTNANTLLGTVPLYTNSTAPYSSYNTSIAVDPFASQQYTTNDVFVIPCGTKNINYSGEGETEDMSKPTNRKMLYFYDLKVLDLRPETDDSKRVVVPTILNSIVVKERADVRQQIIMKEMKGALAEVENLSELELVINIKNSWYIEEKVD